MARADFANESIVNFSLNEEEFSGLNKFDNVSVIGNGSLFFRGANIQAKVKINFGDTVGCKVFFGNNLKGNISVVFKGNNSILFIGNNCKLNDLQIRSLQPDDFIAVGNGVTTTSKNTWISGNGAGSAKPAIVVGDDCMFSYDIVIRNSDAHPIFSIETEEQLNEPIGIVHLEPHVWVGEQVSILKSVTVGACSILSLGSVVTRDVPRFSVASGVPAVAKPKPDIFWARSASDKAKSRAKYFVNKYRGAQ
ncbi:MAG: acyltransferase [Gammaproteobacteria bacterium]|nr:acyltransferase [Gammaproteobacteria bacterium]